MTAGLAFAGDNKSRPDQILNALSRSRSTRGLSAGPQADPTVRPRKPASSRPCATGRPVRSRPASARKWRRSPRTSRTSTLKSTSTTTRPRSGKSSGAAVEELGKALSDPTLKGSTFMVAGHTDAVGSEGYNQDLSERRADTIKKVADRGVRHQRFRSRDRRLWQVQAQGYPTTRRRTRSTAAFRSSTWIPRPRRSNLFRSCLRSIRLLGNRQADFSFRREITSLETSYPVLENHQAVERRHRRFDESGRDRQHRGKACRTDATNAHNNQRGAVAARSA